MAQDKSNKVLLGYTGSLAGHMLRWSKGLEDLEPEPVHVSKKDYKKLKEHERLDYYSSFL